MSDAIAAVHARLQSIQARFASAPPGFSQALAAAGQGVGGVVGARSSVADAPTADLASSLAAQQRSALRGAARAPSAASRGAPAGDWAQHLPAAGRPWADDIEAAARAEGVPPALLGGLVWQESGFRADAVSHAGAIGLGQLMPGTAEGLGVDPWDPQQNLRGAARYLRIQLDRFGREDHALAAYNAGPGRVQRAGGIPAIAETQAYVPRVLAYRDRLEGRR